MAERAASDDRKGRLESATGAPFYATARMSLTYLEPGIVAVELRPGIDVTDDEGTLLPGVAAAVADAALGAAVYSLLPPTQVSQTVELRLDAVPAVAARADRLVGRGVAVHLGSSTGFARGEIADGEGNLRATANCRCVIRDAAPNEHAALQVAGSAPRWLLEPAWHELRVEPEATAAADLDAFLGSTLARRLGVKVAGVSEASVVVRIPASTALTNMFGTIHGGAVSLFAEVAIAVALHALLPRGSSFAVLDFAINFLRPVPADGVVAGEAEIVHGGRRFSVVRAQLRNPDGRIAALTSSTVYVLR